MAEDEKRSRFPNWSGDREVQYLIEKIIAQVENSKNQWKRGSTGRKSLDNKKGQLFSREHLQSEVSRAAEILEEVGIIQINWSRGYRGLEFASLSYRLEDMPYFYELYQKTVDSDFQPRWYWTQKYRVLVEEELAQIERPWIRAYYENLLSQAESRNIRERYEKTTAYKECFRGLDKQEEPIYKRLFSKKYLRDAKWFEKECQGYVVKQARKYCGRIDADLEEAEMSDTEILSQIFIEEYAQELSVKGPLCLEMKVPDGTGWKYIQTGDWFYGATLNSEMLKNARISKDQPGLKRIITIENKANFVSAPYQEDTLYVFSHGYFTPKEKEFLQKLYCVLKGQNICYLHSGDLDYGGVKIFHYIKTKIFPDLMPLYMDVETFEAYAAYAEPIEEQKLEKLKKLEEPLLQPVIDKMIETGLGIEQESFLLKGEGNL